MATMPGQTFNVIVERDSEGWYIASVPDLPGCHTQARSLDELLQRTTEAITVYLEAREDEGQLEPVVFVGMYQVST